MDDIDKTIQAIEKSEYPINRALHELHEFSLLLILSQDKPTQTQLIKKQEKLIQDIQRGIDQFSPPPISKHFKAFVLLWEKYQRFIYQLQEEIQKKDQREVAIKNINDGEIFRQLDETFSLWTQENINQAHDTYRYLYGKNKLSQWFELILFGLSSILLIFLSRNLSQRIVGGVTQLDEYLKILAQGEVVEKDITYHGQDEIKNIIESVQQLNLEIKQTIAHAQAITQGDYEQESLSGQGQLAQVLFEMVQELRHATLKNTQQDWLKTGQMRLNEQTSGEQQLVQLAEKIITFLTPYVEAQVGAFYVLEEAEVPLIKMIASHAYTWRKHSICQFKIGEGLVGQAALERKLIIITEAPEDYLYVQSGLGGTHPRAILVIPFLYEGTLEGVIELASLKVFTPLQIEFLKQVMPGIGIVVNTAQSRLQMQKLLHQTQIQTSELQTQAEELQSQQEELRQTNEELEEKTKELEQQKEHIREKNLVLQKSQQEIEAKARQLELASKYKSEFLANMSHELRTPLNSLLILAQILAENKKGNLEDKQVKYAQTIHSAGTDLLRLINDILDLSKIEAGKIEIRPEKVLLDTLLESIEHKFRHVAESKNLGFHVHVAPGFPSILYTDSHRLKQILNNLLSNAFKFTAQGDVRLEFRKTLSEEYAHQSHLPSLAISVTDTGIGIPKEKQCIIFEAFQQVDGSISRRYGGTGLGLSISRQLACLLGGDIKLSSEDGKGSCFTLYLPEKIGDVVETSKASFSDEEIDFKLNFFPPPPEKAPKPPAERIVDDRNNLHPEDKFILIIEDDDNFLRLLLELARERNFKCLVAQDGEIGLQLAREYKPQAILLDVNLPKKDGWSIMEALKENPETRHIPVHFMSGADVAKEAKKMGAIGYLLKPVNLEDLGEAFKKIEHFADKRVKNLLIVVDNEQRQQEVLMLINQEGIHVLVAATQENAYQQLQSIECDCIIIDIDVENSSGIQLLDRIYCDENLSGIPVVLYTPRELTPEEDKILQRYENNLTIKAVKSPERLLDEATLFLHQLEANLSKEKRKILQMMHHDKAAILNDKKILLVDDDARNTFALTTVLENKNMEVLVAENGKEALKILDEHQHDIDIVLMDIMMPEMNGYEAMQKIREQERFRKLPIIALTAKAMKGDKAKCIEAGANDYLAKPVDTDKLLSLMRVWLYR